MIKLKGIGHVNLRVADQEVSKRFYRDVLGFVIAEAAYGLILALRRAGTWMVRRGGVIYAVAEDSFRCIDLRDLPSIDDDPNADGLG